MIDCTSFFKLSNPQKMRGKKGMREQKTRTERGLTVASISFSLSHETVYVEGKNA